jgi:putative PIN family toxin of toxin-antitoxin system
VPSRKERIPVVSDTNIVIGYYLSRNSKSAISRIFHLWRDLRKLQFVVSQEMLDEYLEILERISVPKSRIEKLKDLLLTSPIVTRVQLGTRPTASRDPDDNIILATAIVGKAKFLITNDLDLLDISDKEKKRFKFEILKPAEFLARLEE